MYAFSFSYKYTAIKKNFSDFMIILLLYYLTYINETFKLYRKIVRFFHSLAAVFELHTEKTQQLSKMATGEEKAFDMLEFLSHQSVITVQRHFRKMFEKDAQRRVPTPFGDGICNLKLQHASESVAVERIRN